MFSGCYYLVGTVEGIIVLQSSGVLEALGTSEYLFPRPDTGDTQGTVQLG